MGEAPISHRRVLDSSPEGRITPEQYFDVAWLCWSKKILQVVLRYGSCKLVKIPSFAWKVPLWGNLKEKWQLK